MRDLLFRSVHSAVTAFKPRLRPTSGETLPPSAIPAGGLREAAREMQDYTFCMKAEFHACMRGRLAERHRELDEILLAFPVLRERVVRLEGQLDALVLTDDSSWDDEKTGFGGDYDRLVERFRLLRACLIALDRV